MITTSTTTTTESGAAISNTTGSTSATTAIRNGGSATTMTLSERLHQARSNRRSLGNHSNKTPDASTTQSHTRAATTMTSTSSTIPGLHSPITTAVPTVSTTATTTSASSNGYRYSKPIRSTVETNSSTTPAMITTKSSVESNGSTSSSSSKGIATAPTTNHPTTAIAQRYRTLPGFVASPPPSSSSSTTTQVTNNNSTTPAALPNKSISLGRYRPSSMSKSPIPMTAPSSAAAATTTATPPSRTWRNIHELVQKIEASDTPSSSSSHNASTPTPPARSDNHTAKTSSNAPSQQYPSWKYRNLHNTISSKEESNEESVAESTTTNTKEATLPKSTTTPSSPEPVMNRWKYKYNTTNNCNGVVGDGNNEKTATIQKGSVLETTVSPPPTTATRSKVAAPHSYVPAAPSQHPPQYSFVSSPTNGSTATSSTNGFMKKQYLANGGGGGVDETSTLSLGTSHSFASSQSSLSQNAVPSQSSPTVSHNGLRTTVVPNSSIDSNNNTAPTSTHTKKSNMSPTSLTLSNSRSFGSQPSVSKSPSTDAISTVPSWKSAAQKKKNGTAVSTGPAVYGSPVPAWKKKLLEQQRQQQQEQEKAAQSIPKWKLKQLEQKQQQQTVVTANTEAVQIPSTTAAASTVSIDDNHNIVTSPSDERHDSGIVAAVDNVIATALSNVAVIHHDTDQNAVTKNGSTKWSTPQNIHPPTKVETVSRPRLRLGASPETDSFGPRGGMQPPGSTGNSMASTKSSWFNKTHPNNGDWNEPKLSTVRSGPDTVVAAPSEDTVSVPSPEKDDPAEHSGIGESTSLLSPRRRGDIMINTAVDTSVNNDTAAAGRAKQWESPRTARLEAMKANANHTAPSSAFSRPVGPMGKASPVVVPSHLMKSPETATTTKKWQPPKKETPKSTFNATVAPEKTERFEKPVPSTESMVVVSEESTKKSSVAEMKAKLWGTGKSEKLVVAPTLKDSPVVRDVGESEWQAAKQVESNDVSNSFGSPTRTDTNNERVLSMTPPKPNSATSKSVGTTSQSVLPNFTRGRPDVCTPNGPLPPQRSSGRGDKQLPPRRNLDTLWMNRLEHANNENVATAPFDVISDETSMPRSLDTKSNDNKNEVVLSVNESNAIYSESTKDYIEGLQNDRVLPPPPPPAERNSHHRSPSIGDFQVAANQSVKEIVEDVSSEFVVSSPPVSPRMSRPSDPISPTIRPAVMTKWDDMPPTSKSGSVSPTSRRLLPPKLPPTSPAANEKKDAKGRFSELIDCPPLDDSEKWGNDADVTGPKELIDAAPHPLSPRSKQDRPWTKDANTLSPSTWMKPKSDPPIASDRSTPPRPPRSDPPSEVERMGDEKKSSEDVLFQAQSPSSLMRMAADSIHAVDYDKAVQGLQRQSILDEDDESLLSAATPGSTIPTDLPPEFEKAISDTEEYEQRAHIPVFGDPSSFGAAGGEVIVEPSVRVADRAKALASWNGGLGVSPTRPAYPETEIAPTLSPIRREESESEVEGMSPRITKRGFGLDDWKRTKSFDSKSEFETSSDFWQPSNLDNQSQVDERDWSKCEPDVDGSNVSRSDSLTKEAASFPAPAPDVVVSTHEPTAKRSTPPLLEKSKMDTDSRPKMTWKKKPLVPKPDGTSVPPRPTPKAGSVKTRKSDIGSAPIPLLSGRSNQTLSTTNHDNLNSFDPFDPFEFSFNNGTDKVEFTEVTEFSDGTDFFNASDPFNMDPSSFPMVKEQKPPISTNTAPSTLVAPPSNVDDNDDGVDADVEYEDEYLYDGEYPPTLSGLNPPSGSNLSQYEVWSYDADTSNLQDGAAEI